MVTISGRVSVVWVKLAADVLRAKRKQFGLQPLPCLAFDSACLLHGVQSPR